MWNEEEYVERALAFGKRACESPVANGDILDYELIVVDDASTDPPRDRRPDGGAGPRVFVVHHARNRKLGGAMKTGFAAATGDLILYTDADLPFDMAELPRAVRLLREYDVDIVSAYRFDRTGEGSLRSVYTFVYNALIKDAVRREGARHQLRVQAVPATHLRARRAAQRGVVHRRRAGHPATRLGFEMLQFGVDYFPRTRGVSTLSSPSVITTILKEMWELRHDLEGIEPSSTSAEPFVPVDARPAVTSGGWVGSVNLRGDVASPRRRRILVPVVNDRPPLPPMSASGCRPLLAAGVLAIVVAAGVALGGGTGDSASQRSAATVTFATSPTVPSIEPVASSASAEPVKTQLTRSLSKGMAGDDVADLQQRLTDLGFWPGPIDGYFGDETRRSVWAYEKLVLGVPFNEPTGTVTAEMWDEMQDPFQIAPRRPDSTPNHTEIYLPEQVIAVFHDDVAVFISHMSSGDNAEWCEEVTISPGEWNNPSDEPLVRGECGRSVTPGGVFSSTAASKASVRARSAACGTRCTSTTASRCTAH
jgi:hypothetical protein